MAFCEVFGILIDTIVTGSDVDKGKYCFVREIVKQTKNGDRFFARSEMYLMRIVSHGYQPMVVAFIIASPSQRLIRWVDGVLDIHS